MLLRAAVMSESHPYFSSSPAATVPGQSTVYVKFGPAAHQEIRAEVAEAMLQAWYGSASKLTFGDALRAAMLAERNGHG